MMGKDSFQYKVATPESLKIFHRLLTVVILLILSGCMTTYAIDLAKEKATPANTYHFWEISKVWSAIEQNDGSILVSTDMKVISNSTKAEPHIIILPRASLLKQKLDMKTLGFLEIPLDGVIEEGLYGPSSYHYYYPLDRLKKSRRKLNDINEYPQSNISIVKLTFHVNDQIQLFSLLSEYRENEKNNDKLYEVRFLKREEESKTKMCSDKITTDNAVWLVYWPADINEEFIRPIAIRGGYSQNDESTNLFYLLVPPALIFDLIIIGLSGAFPPG